VVDTGTDAEQDLQVRELRQIGRWLPCRQIAHQRRVADVGPQAQAQLRHLLGQNACPDLTALRIGGVQQGHRRRPLAAGRRHAACGWRCPGTSGRAASW
jgi:hypothetical protein